jgi:hypothetical protein
MRSFKLFPPPFFISIPLGAHLVPGFQHASIAIIKSFRVCSSARSGAQSDRKKRVDKIGVNGSNELIQHAVTHRSREIAFIV